MFEQAGENSTWGLNLEAAICERCDWRYLLLPELLPLKCPHCFQATLTSLEGQVDNLSRNHPPESMLPFSVSSETLSQKIQQFAGDIWFAPGDLNPQNLKTRLQRVFLSMWLVDSQVQAIWQAEVGFNYEAVSYRDSFDDNRGGWHSQQVTERRIRWEPRLGRLTRTYHNIPAPALEEHFELIRQLGRYDLETSRPYRSEALGQALVRLPNRSPADAWPDAVPAFQSVAIEECCHAAGADHLREFRWAAQYHHQNWTLLLLPLYTTYYLDDDQNPQPVLIHGQTGQLAGPKRASMKRARQATLVIAAIATIIFILSLMVAAASFFVPPLLVVAALGIILAIVVGLLAITPLVIAWQINQKNR